LPDINLMWAPALMQPHSPVGQQESARKHVYNPQTRTWSVTNITVTFSPRPFQEGTMRHVFQLTDHSLAPGQQQCVAKLSKDPNEPRETYFAETEMQYKCKDLACQFNSRNPPKRVDFAHAWVVEFVHRRAPHGGPLVALVEPLLRGRYTKHSNNFGFVSPEDRNTPHAFSHWTWVASGGQLLVCDIQGVGDLYTDPQIHSNAGPQNFLYGRGDMGIEGIQRFFASHKCNDLCRWLALPPAPGQQISRPFEKGTTARDRPASPAMDFFSSRSPIYSPNLSPASSVGGVSTGSGALMDVRGRISPHPFIADHAMGFPQLSLPMVIGL
jgi:hypothetical protein